jgi:3-dehydroquinate synthase class II
MGTLTLDKPKRKLQQRVVLNVAARKYDFLMELLGSFDFVQVEDNSGDSREAIVANLKQAAKDLKLIKAGKLKGRSARELLNEL